MDRFFLRTKAVLASESFFWFIIGLFLFQSLWIALSALYPMAFDEAYHFTLTQVYAAQWLPFLAEHPDGMNLNAVTRYPSYFFHYLMSFPYRIITLFTEVEYTQIILLRIINVGFFAASLVLFRKLLRMVGLSRALSNIGILLFSLIPIVPLLAAQINYDNLLLLLIAWMLLLSAHIIASLRRDEIPMQELLTLGIVGLFASIVKYAVLPILLVIFLFLATYLVLTLKERSKAEILEKVRAGWSHILGSLKIILPLLLLLGGILFFERYGLNLIRYQALIPACDDVLTHEQCMEFGPYERNTLYDDRADPNFEPSRLEHAQRWTSGMWYRLFFMINGDVPVDRYQNFAPLPLPAISATLILIAGLGASLFYWRDVFRRRPLLILLVLCALFYMLVLLLQNYGGYAARGRTAALNGRYLLLILPALIAVTGLGLARLMHGNLRLKVITAILVIGLFSQGGGLVSFIVRSDYTWYWPIRAVEDVNLRSQELLHPVIFGSEDEHLRWVPH